MNIQLISTVVRNFKNITEVGFNEYNAFDDFDINIIDLSDESFWIYPNGVGNKIVNFEDIKSLKTSLLSTKKSKIILILPQNILISSQNIYACEIKNRLDLLWYELYYLLGMKSELRLSYAKTKTVVNDKNVNADFHFMDCPYFIPITCSDKSKVYTTISWDKYIITTLDIAGKEESIIKFLEHIKLCCSEADDKPEWFDEISFHNDTEIKNQIAEVITKIEKLNAKKQELECNLDELNNHKSIVYLSGDALAERVSVILDKLIGYNYKEFVDLKKQDFLIEKQNIIFIGEIKGVSTNVKSKDVSQCYNHVCNYFDEKNPEKDLKGILIMNQLKNIKPDEREKVSADIIAQAKRNEILIVTTPLLLKLFEKFLNKQITKDKIIELFTKKVGLFEI